MFGDAFSATPEAHARLKLSVALAQRVCGADLGALRADPAKHAQALALAEQLERTDDLERYQEIGEHLAALLPQRRQAEQ
jgi:hypothetical protein